MHKKPPIGFISTWPVYQGTAMDRYAHLLIQGISAAADEQGCNLLLGCGFSVTGNSPHTRSFLPIPALNVNFVPVGPWNTDGLIIIPDNLNKEQFQSDTGWENQALFDYDNRALPAMNLFNRP